MDTAKPVSVILQATNSRRLPNRRYIVVVRVTVLSLTPLPGDIVIELGELIPSDDLPEQERLRFKARRGDRGVEVTRVVYSFGDVDPRQRMKTHGAAVRSLLRGHGYRVVSERRLVRQAPPWLCIQSSVDSPRPPLPEVGGAIILSSYIPTP